MKRAAFNKRPSPRLSHRLSAVAATLAVPLSCLLIQGCSTTTGTRANERSAAIGNLSSTDRQLAMHGDIQKGFSQDAVYVAWGTPSQKRVNHTAHGPQECWTYVSTYNGTGGGYFGVSRGLVHGKQGDYYDTDNYYPAPDTAQTLGSASSTEVPIKRVVFEKGKVISFETASSQQDDDHGDDGGSYGGGGYRSSQENNLVNPG